MDLVSEMSLTPTEGKKTQVEVEGRAENVIGVVEATKVDVGAEGVVAGDLDAGWVEGSEAGVARGGLVGSGVAWLPTATRVSEIAVVVVVVVVVAVQQLGKASNASGTVQGLACVPKVATVTAGAKRADADAGGVFVVLRSKGVGRVSSGAAGVFFRSPGFGPSGPSLLGCVSSASWSSCSLAGPASTSATATAPGSSWQRNIGNGEQTTPRSVAPPRLRAPRTGAPWR